MDAELEILEALDKGELTKADAQELLGALSDKNTPVVNEMHPGIDFTTRAVYKNFGNDPEASFNYLQKQHPELTFKKDADGEVLAKAPGDDAWRKLDPSGFRLSDLGQDLTDVGYDVAAGLGEGVAAVGGGIAGGVAGLPLGPGAVATGLGGAAAAGGAAGGTLEALRHKIGGWAGINQDVDLGDVGTSAAFGAAAPLLLGTGAATKHIAKAGMSAATKRGLGDKGTEALMKNLTASQRGLGSRALGKTGAALGQAMSGIDSDMLSWARNNLDSIKAAEQSGTGGAEIYGELKDQITGAVENKLADSGERLGQLSADSGIVIDVDKVEKPLVELLAKYEAKAMRSIDKHGDAALGKADYIKSETLQNTLNPYLEDGGTIRGAEVKEHLDKLNEITGISSDLSVNVNKSIKKDLASAAKRAATNLDKEASQGPAGRAWKDERSEYAKLLSVQKDVLQKYFKDDTATERTLNNLLSSKNKARKLGISKALNKIDVDIDDTARESLANSLFVNPSMDPLSLGGTTSTSRTVPLAGLGGVGGYLLGGSIGGHGAGMTGAAIGGYLGSKAGSPMAMRRAMELDAMAKGGWEGLNNNLSLFGAPPIQSGLNILRHTEDDRGR